MTDRPGDEVSQTVYITRSQVTPKVYHTDPECTHLPGDAREKTLSQVQPIYTKECERCAKNRNERGKEDDHYNTLKNASPDAI